jgi:hypothetical protein
MGKTNNKQIFNSSKFQNSSHQKRQELTSWDRQTLPFKPPRPCLLYYLVELPMMQSPRSLNAMSSLYTLEKREIQTVPKSGNNKKDKLHRKTAQKPKPKLLQKKGKKDSSSSDDDASSSSSSSSSQQEEINQNIVTETLSNSKKQELLQQQNLVTSYYPVMRVCVPDREGFYWDLDPTKIYYFEEYGSTTTTTPVVLEEILPVLPRYDTRTGDGDKKEIGVQANVWTTTSCSSSFSDNYNNNGSNPNKNQKQKIKPAFVQGMQKQQQASNQQQQQSLMNLAGIRRARTMVTGSEIIRILSDPAKAAQTEEERLKNQRKKNNLFLDEDNNNNNEEDEEELQNRLSLAHTSTRASVQGISFLRFHVGFGGGGSVNNNNNNNFTMSQLLNNNNNFQASQMASQQSLASFLSQQSHSGVVREKDEVIKRSVEDALRYLPTEYRNEIKNVLGLVDRSWK